MSIINSFECTNISWRTVTLTYSLSEKADGIYIHEKRPYLMSNGSIMYVTKEYGFASTADATYLSGGERTLDVEPKMSYYFRLEVVKDGQSTYSEWISVKALGGCKSITAYDLQLDCQNGNYDEVNAIVEIVVEIENPDKSNVVLELHLYTKESYDESNNSLLHTNIRKEIGSIDGTYVWNLNDEEKEKIFQALKYSTITQPSSIIGASSYVPGEDTENANSLTYNYDNISISLGDGFKPIINTIVSSPDSKTFDILSNDGYLIQGMSSVTTKLNMGDVIIGTGADLYSVIWRITTPSGNVSTETVIYSSQTEFEKNIDSSQLSETGTYQFGVIVTDTRRLQSDEFIFTYNSLSYHRPIIYAKVIRPLMSNGAVSLTYQASYSRLAIANQDKNSITNISYGYRNIIESTDYSTATLTGYTISNSQNGVDKELTLTDETWLEEGSVDTEKNYKFMFMLIDKVHAAPTFYYVDLVDGTPIMRMLNNGQISIGMMPDTSDESTLLFVNSDIQAIDPYGEQRKVFETMGNMIQLSNEQPNNQMANGLWLTEDGHMRIKTDEGYSEISPKTNATLVTLSNADETTVADKIESINTNIEEVSNDVTALQDNLSGLVFRKGGFQVTCDANSTVSHDITFDGFATNPFIYLSLFTQGASNQKYITATTQIESRSTTGATINISNNSSTAAIVQCGWMAVGQ